LIIDYLLSGTFVTSMDDFQASIATTLRNALPSAEYQLFIDHFHMYLMAKPGDLVVDLDDVREWIGYAYKHHAKRDIIKNIDTTNYSITKNVRGGGRGGHNMEKIMLSVRGFKQLCLLAGTTKGIGVRNYYNDMVSALLPYMLDHVAHQKIIHDQITQELIDLTAERDLIENSVAY
jgi:hypothetical protein